MEVSSMTKKYINLGNDSVDASTTTEPSSRVFRNAWVWNEPFIELDHDAMKPIARAVVDTNYNGAHDALVAGYTDDETSTWAKQESEARAHTNDSSASTPFLDAYVINNPSLSGRSNDEKKATLAAKIVAKADAFEQNFAKILGTSKELKSSIENSEDAATLDTMDLSIKIL